MASYAKHRGVAKMGSGNHKYEGDVIPVFDPEFETFADEYAKQLADTKDDPYLLGHFSDNEMPLRTNALDLCLQLDQSDRSYQAAMDGFGNETAAKMLGLMTSQRMTAMRSTNTI